MEPTNVSRWEGVIEMACLGRPFRLGMLYDCRSDNLIPGMTLWNDEQLKSARDSSEQVGSNCKFIAEDSLQTKASELNVNGGLKLSFIGSMFEVAGSAGYLKDQRSSKRQCRVSLKYSSTSRFDQLTMDQLGNIQHPHVISNKLATHVVVGVIYGAEAFFVFDRMVKLNEVEGKVHGEMGALVKRLPQMLNVGGQFELSMKMEEKEEATKIECKYYGDLQLTENPTTFEDAVQIFRQLPELLKQGDGPVVVPKKVWLYPLIKLNSDAAKIVHDISVNLVSNASKLMEEFHHYEIQCNDLINFEVCVYLTSIKAQLLRFKEIILQYKMDFVKKLASLLPSIREGGMEESQLADMFKLKKASPFSSCRLKSWLQTKQKEIMILKKHIESLSGVVDFVTDLNELIFDLNYRHVVCFSFQIPKPDDATLESMQSFLDMRKILNPVNATILWLKRPMVLAEMREKVSQFLSFAKVNEKREGVKFVVAEYSDECVSDISISILHFDNGVRKVFDIPTPPEKLKFSNITDCSIKLEWLKPKCGSDAVQNYVVHCWVADGPSNECFFCTTTGNETSMIVDNLQPETTYYFQVCTECETGASKFTEVSHPIVTLRSNRLVALMKAQSTKVCNEIGPATYVVNGVHINLPEKMLHKVEIGEKQKGIHEKVLLLLGAAGTGKTTLINGMINYIFGVQWQDQYRFKLITEETKSQAQSQTSAITAYTLHHMSDSCLNYNLTIIDTPGFGDNAGLKRDKEIIAQIKELFSIPAANGISHLNGIGFVTQSALVRLSPAQQYIFDSILCIFGKNVENNIFIMVTFADSPNPPVMSAIEAAKVPYSDVFVFNNSQIFTEISDDEDDIRRLIWKNTMKSYKKFFCTFQRTESVSLTLTKDVLHYREQLEVISVGLQTHLRECLETIEELHNDRKVLVQHERDIEMNKDFTFTVKNTYRDIEVLPKGESATSCLNCKFTCHHPCSVPINQLRVFCSAIGGISKCKVCKDHCHWSEHKLTDYKYIQRSKKVQMTSKELKQKYERASKGKADVKALLANHQCQLEKAYAQFHIMIAQAQQCLIKLDEIALNPSTLTQLEYIELLINVEKQQARSGWKERINELENIKEQAQLLAALKDVDKIDERIAQERQKKNPDWEQKVETFEKLKRIKLEVESIMEQGEEGEGSEAEGVN